RGQQLMPSGSPLRFGRPTRYFLLMCSYALPSNSRLTSTKVTAVFVRGTPFLAFKFIFGGSGNEICWLMGEGKAKERTMPMGFPLPKTNRYQYSPPSQFLQSEF